MEKLFATSPPGLEPFTAFELNRLGLLNNKKSHSQSIIDIGGIEFVGSVEAIYKANLHLRTANRILLRLGDFHAAAFSELNRHAQRLPWNRFIKSGQKVAIRVTCHKSRLYHSAAVTREVIKAINKTVREPVIPCKAIDDQTGAFPQLIIVRLVNDHCTISIDTSGELLHRRGYRLATAKAPLRETLAAGLLFASDWDCISPLLDPFCGSGTIAIEAAMIAHQIPPGRYRTFAFMDWPDFLSDHWHAILEASQNLLASKPNTSLGRFQIAASDRDAGAVQVASANAKRANVAEYIEFSQRAVSSVEIHSKGWLVTNPPYGIRVSDNKDLRNLYAQLGNIMRLKCRGWSFAIMCSDLALLHQLDIPMETNLTLINGGIHVQVARGIVPD